MPHGETLDTTAGVGAPIVTRGRPTQESVKRLNAALRGHVYEAEHVLVPILVLPHVAQNLRRAVYAPDTSPASAIRRPRARG